MAYFKRNIDKSLQAWKDSALRKPLLLRGARQIGKSSSVRNLGLEFTYYIEVNLESDRHVAQLFNEETDVREICRRLSILYSTPVIEGETLIFLDEIQASPAALKSLWFFKENIPDLHIIAAGSLLEFALKSLSSYGVGRVSSVFMYPMAFNEFLEAVGKSGWVKEINESNSNNPLFDALHRQIVNQYRTFLMVGGMPASVKAWVETQNYEKCIQELADIQQSYYDDFAKYARTTDPELLRATLQSVISQTGGKFVYSKVVGGYSIEEVKRALRMLEDAGIVKKVRHTAANGLPLGADINEKFSRYMYLDTGLFLRILDMDFGGVKEITETILTDTTENLVNKGKLAEMSAGWEMVKASDIRYRYELFYWENLSNGATAEVDFVIPYRMKILPIEVKAGTSGKMKSLRLFMERKNISYAIRSSLENFGLLEYKTGDRSYQISILPIYAIGRLTRR